MRFTFKVNRGAQAVPPPEQYKQSRQRGLAEVIVDQWSMLKPYDGNGIPESFDVPLPEARMVQTVRSIQRKRIENGLAPLEMTVAAIDKETSRVFRVDRRGLARFAIAKNWTPDVTGRHLQQEMDALATDELDAARV